MQVAVRSRLNMGIALAGAGAIALAPIAQPMPAIAELQARAVSSAQVALTAAANPIEQWAQIIQDTLANGGTLVQNYLNNPLPIVHQLILNGAGYVGQTVTALQSSFSNLVDSLRFDNPYGFPAGVQQGLSQILAGQIYEGYNTLFSAGLGLIIGPVFPLLDLLQIPVTMVQNVANVVAKVPNTLLFMGLGAIGTINGTLQATAFQVQAVVDALKTGDLFGAVGAIVATPGAIVNAVLNGFAFSGAPGLLSPGGLIDQVMQALNTFAQAIAPATATPLAAKVADTSPSALPSAALSVATATLGSETVATPEAKTATAETTAAEPAATEPAATEPTATEPAATTPETPSTPTETKPETKPESGATSGSTTTPNGGTDATGGNKAEPGKPGEPTKPSGSTGSETGSGSTGSESTGSGSGTGASGSGSGASGSGASGSGSGAAGGGASGGSSSSSGAAA
ncbi:hypothetical protein [Mycobacterium sp. AZCC_0083]|uniref:hypothetical protein n=1 Tax=Mycobacterium sp. AZCC_0083 TaxID=2735882 RepID=UPI00161C8C7B|nr:hypothetical protein [Mycobacterium sp. AZCC_0083]MBB5162190.1 putative membrane protein YgcG [Mycobacterium sp. AZCC_0083]